MFVLIDDVSEEPEVLGLPATDSVSDKKTSRIIRFPVNTTI